MSVASKAIRNQMLLTTAVAAIAAVPSAAHAQLVRSTDLSSAIDGAGNPNQITVTDTSATVTDIEVQASVVVAEWTDFNIDLGDTVNVTINPGLALSEATLFNRVIGLNPSNMNGTLNAADINFWLVNQNGIMFGNDSAINANSFFASTLDVANQDIFDFYAGSDLFGNGSSTLNFAGTSTAALNALGNASFVTDGSLMFVGQELNLAGSFDAGTGKAAFIAASDLDVTFTPGSPLSYTVNAGTTVATQVIDGTVEGASAEFAVFTATGVANALLQVDATVTATTAVATDNGITLIAEGLGATSVDATINGELSSNGTIDIDADGDLTATAQITGSAVTLDTPGAINAQGVRALAGDLALTADTITATNLRATGGDVLLSSVDDITTSVIRADAVGGVGGSIDVDASAAGRLELGDLFADDAVSLDTSDRVVLSSLDADGALTIGAATTPLSVRFNGSVAAGSIDIDATGAVIGQGISANDGDLEIDASLLEATSVQARGGDLSINVTGDVTTNLLRATTVGGMGGAISVLSTGGGRLDLGDLRAGTSIDLDTTDRILADVVNAGGDVTIGGTNTPLSVRFNDAASGGSLTITAVDTVTTQNLTSDAGDVTVSATTIEAGDVRATGGNVSLTASGEITTASITATMAGAMTGAIDVNSTGGGNLDLGDLQAGSTIDIDTTGELLAGEARAGGALTVGGVDTPSMVEFTGDVIAASIDITSAGSFTAPSLTADAGGIDVTADTIATGDVSATGGDVGLVAAMDVTTTSIMATGGAIDVESTGGGNLDLGDLTAGLGVDLDTTGTVEAGTVDAGGALTVGGTDQPSAVTFTGTVTAGSIDIDTPGALSGSDFTATDGAMAIDALSLTADQLNAADGIIVSVAGPLTIAGAAANTDNDTDGDLLLRVTTADALTVTGEASGTNVTLRGGGAVNAGSIDATSSDVAAGNVFLNGASITSGNIMATGDIRIESLGSVNLADVIADRTNDGAGDVLIGGSLPPSDLTITGQTSGANVTIRSLGAADMQAVTATAGDVVVDADSISATMVRATDGDVDLTAAGDITTTSITATTGTMGGAIDIDSTGGGNLDLGDLNADLGIDLDTTGDVTAGLLRAGGALTVDGDAVTFTDLAAAESITIAATGAVSTQSLSGNAGDVAVTSTGVPITATSVLATGGNVDLVAAGAISTSSIRATVGGASTGAITVESTAAGDLDLGNVRAGDSVTLDTDGAVRAGLIRAGSDVTIGGMSSPSSVDVTNETIGANVDITSTGAINLGSVTAQGAMGVGGDVSIDGDSVTAGAVTAINDLAILGVSSVSLDSARADSDSSGVGDLLLRVSGGNLTVGGPSSGVSVVLRSSADMLVENVTATGGNAFLNAASIDADAVSATGGDVRILTTGNITTESITATEAGMIGGSIDVDSNAGGVLDLGDVSASNNIGLDTDGSLTANRVTAGGNLNIGQFLSPSSVTLTAAAEGANVLINSDGMVTAQNITANDGNLSVTAAGIDAQEVSATNNLTLDSTANVSVAEATADSDGDLAGDLLIRAVGAGATLDIGGPASGANVTLRSAGAMTVEDVMATNGAVQLNGASIDGDAISATDLVRLESTGSISIDSARADSDSSGAGDLILRAAGGDLAVSGSSSGVSTVLRALNAMNVGDVTATAGNAFLSAASIVAGAVSATGGDARLRTTGDITTESITANEAGMIGGSVDVESVSGGNLDLGNVTASNDIEIGTDGSLTANRVMAGGDVKIGQFLAPSSVALTGATEGADVLINSDGLVTAQNITATAGNLSVTAAGIDAEAVSATNNLTLNSTADISIAEATADSDGDLAGDVLIRAVGPGAALDVGGSVSGANVTLRSAGAMAIGTEAMRAGDVTATNGDVLMNASSIVADAISATELVRLESTGSVAIESALGDSDGDHSGDVIIRATGGSLTITDPTQGVNVLLRSAGALDVDTVTSTDGDVNISGATVTTGAINANAKTVADGGNVAIVAPGSITTGAITAATDTMGGRIDIDSLGGGDVTLASLRGDGDITLDTAGALNVGSVNVGASDTTIGSLKVGATAAPSSATFTGRVRATDINMTVVGALQAIDLTSTVGDIFVQAGSVMAESLFAADNLTLQTTGSVELIDALANQDGDGTGDVLIRAVAPDADVTVTGLTSGQNVTVRAVDDVNLARVTANAGNVFVSGASIVANNVLATGGDARLIATGDADGSGDITTSTITARTAGMAGGAIEVVSLDGGTLNLGDLDADTQVELRTAGLVQANEILAGTDLIISGGAVGTSVLLTGNATAANIDIDGVGAVEAQDLTALAGDVAVNSAGLTARNLSASANVTVESAGTVSLVNVTADDEDPSDGVGNVTIRATAPGAALSITGATSGVNTTLRSSGAMTVGDVAATAGGVQINGSSVVANDVSATGGDVRIISPGDITTNSITGNLSNMMGGGIDVDSVGGGDLDLGVLDADAAIALDTTGSVTAGRVDAGMALTIGGDASPSSVTLTGRASASDIVIGSTGVVTTNDLTATAGIIDIDAASIDTSDLDAAGNVTLDATGDIAVGAIDAEQIDVVSTGGLFSAARTINSRSLINITANDVSLGASVTTGAGSALTLTANDGLSVGLGDAVADFSLSDAELDRLVTETLIINAGMSDVEISNATFRTAAGSNSVVVATQGNISITGNLSGRGTARTFRFGGDVAGTAGILANRITADIEAGNIDFTASNLDLRGIDIIFGQSALIDEVISRNLTSAQVAEEFVGDASSILYAPLNLTGARANNPVYLRVGNLTVTYGDTTSGRGSALFQNASDAFGNIGQFDGVRLGEGLGAGVLSINPVDGENAFALFGQINGLTGPAASIAGPMVIVVDGNVVDVDSRVNGCLIGTGAGCLTTIVGNTIITVPREALSLLGAEDDLVVPFDPLVGTNNEGLFSDATAAPQEDEDCERGEDGLCISN